MTCHDSQTVASTNGTHSRNFSDLSGSSNNIADLKSFVEKCPMTGAQVTLTPLERAPANVYAFTKTHLSEKRHVNKIVSTSRGWRNIFSLPISYDVNMVPHGTLLDPMNSQMLDATGVHEEGYNTRFAVVDAEVDNLYGGLIRRYFEERGIELKVCLVNGGEADKRSQVSSIYYIFM